MKTFVKTLSSVFFLFCGILLISFSCQDKRVMDELNRFKQAEIIKEKNIQLTKRFYQYLDGLSFDSLRILTDSQAKIYSGSGDPVSPADMEPVIKMFYNAFPDFKHQIDEMYASDDKVVVRLTYTGTHENEFMGLKPTGNGISFKGVQIFQFLNNRILSLRMFEDELGMMTQLGMDLRPR